MTPPTTASNAEASAIPAVTQTEAAILLKVSTRTLCRWERRGLIVGKRVGGLKFYPIAQLNRVVMAVAAANKKYATESAVAVGQRWTGPDKSYAA